MDGFKADAGPWHLLFETLPRRAASKVYGHSRQVGPFTADYPRTDSWCQANWHRESWVTRLKLTGIARLDSVSLCSDRRTSFCQLPVLGAVYTYWHSTERKAHPCFRPVRYGMWLAGHHSAGRGRCVDGGYVAHIRFELQGVGDFGVAGEHLGYAEDFSDS